MAFASADPNLESSLMSKPLSAAEKSNAKLGLFLFAAYLLLYAGFVLTNAFAPSAMEQIVWAGLNLAVVYGFGLIFAAFLLALVYGVLCKREPSAKSERRIGDGQ